MSTGGEQFVFNEEPHRGREIGQRPEVKIFKDLVLLHVEQVGRDLRVGSAGEAALIQLAQYQAQERRRDGHLGIARPTRHIFHDPILDSRCE